MEETLLRLQELLFPLLADVTVLSVDVNNEAIRVKARCTAAGAGRPDCASRSSRIHSSYLRLPADVPSAGRRVVLSLQVRRFFCRNASCGRRTFVEQLPGLTRRHSRWTEGLRSTLAAVGLALAGRAGARMARAFGVSVSRSTILRLLDALPEPDTPSPRVVGVDEYATHKGRVYGTVLVDVETPSASGSAARPGGVQSGRVADRAVRDRSGLPEPGSVLCARCHSRGAPGC
ncbi:transposase family protein [Streptomyces sp. NPDC001933]|uniref:transposase family protein n=1 Tax=Streptomyces sp. NPDC001933 TaxID=3364626 RepID=UPI0036A76ABC